MIFSTSAGRLVFNAYKDRPQLPEDVARANGHDDLAQYLQDVNTRLVHDQYCSIPDYLLRKYYFDCFLIIENCILIVQQFRWMFLTWFIHMCSNCLQMLHFLLADCCICNFLPNIVTVHVFRRGRRHNCEYFVVSSVSQDY